MAPTPSAGAVIAWGSDENEQTNVPAEAQSRVTAIAVGGTHALALRDGRVIAWSEGRTIEGQADVPKEAQSGVTAIAAGDLHSLALKQGRVIAWGGDGNGQATVPVEAQSGVTAVAAGAYHSLALKGGRVISWGYDVPVPVEAESGVTAVAAGNSLSMALKDGRVIAWGDDVDEDNVPVEARSGVTAIAAGGKDWLALKDGRVIDWGVPGNGDSGPVPLEAQSGVTAIAGGSGHALALKDGRVIAWGLRGDEQATIPVEAQSAVTAIAAGSVSMAIKDGRDIEWTSDGSAQVPVPVAALSGLPAGGPPRIPYWHAGILHVRGLEIKTPFPVGEIQVAGDTVIIGSKLDENDDQEWALVRGDRIKSLPATAGWPALSPDGRIAFWQTEPTADTTQFIAWDIETHIELASHTVPGNFGTGNRLQRLGVDADGTAYWVDQSSERPVTRWDVHADKVQPTDLAFDFTKAMDHQPAPIPDLWVGFEDAYVSPDGTREVVTECTSRDASQDDCTNQLTVRPVRPIDSVQPIQSVTLQLPEGIPTTRLWDATSDRGMWWVWWESNDAVLLDASTTGTAPMSWPSHSYLVRCSSTDGACQRVLDLGPNSTDGNMYRPDWERDWAFARFPLSN